MANQRPLALVAPLAPFRGGIARHSQVLASTIERIDARLVTAVSFSRLYPRLLYPGASDRDPDARNCPGADYAIDSVNPLSWASAARKLIAARPRFVVMPAWTFFVAPALGWIARRLRKAGIRVVMIVHNASDHEQSGWKSRLLDWQIAAADALLTHSDDLAGQLRGHGADQPIQVCPHPVYSDYPAATHQLARERALELLCFGLVRRYKGVDLALRALAASGLDDVRLTIAGEIWEDRDELAALIDQLGLRGKVQLIDRYVSDAEVAELFDRSDAVLAPYRAVTGSGVAALARHYRRPVIASDFPAFRDCISDGQTGWLIPAGDLEALTMLLRDKVSRKSAAEMGDALDSAASDDGWEAYARAVLALGSNDNGNTGIGA